MLEFYNRRELEINYGVASKNDIELFANIYQATGSLEFLKDINEISKGRYAQRLSTRLIGNRCPDYIKRAIKYVADRCK